MNEICLKVFRIEWFYYYQNTMEEKNMHLKFQKFQFSLSKTTQKSFFSSFSNFCYNFEQDAKIITFHFIFITYITLIRTEAPGAEN